MQYPKLSKTEEKIMLKKGTEAPFSGEYNDFFSEGGYVCRRCGSPLYNSKDKFHSHCGWPSFDDEIKGAVKKELDADGIRTEIICANCGAHLGHVFSGEKLTPKNLRHCVNSLSLKFVPRDFQKGETPQIVLGGGCFWCLDAAFRHIKGITSVVSGYAGGGKENPSYEEVCSGKTGHVEVVKIEYDSRMIDLEKILEIFFKLHDPTTLNRQGADVGEQYRSIILFSTWEQKETAENFIKKLTENKVYVDPIVTELRFLKNFYPAEEYHQDYYGKKGKNSYCHVYK
jgi:peptide methionine sulfoxide reductase msrA/msrB